VKPAWQAGAGKRFSNRLRSKRWSVEMIETYLWLQADERVAELSQGGQMSLANWDESGLEKPESLHLEGLCAVRSSKAVRLKRIKPGCFNPPGGCPAFVPGYHWGQVLVTGMEGRPQLAHMRWWAATTKREVEAEILREAAQRWGSQIIHLWDWGFAGSPWLGLAYLYGVRFIMVCWMSLSRTARPGNACEGDVPGSIVCCGMHGGAASARRVSWRCASTTKPITNPCGGWLPDAARDKNAGICSPTNPV